MESLRVLYLSSGDLIGSRFNGYDWLDELEYRGVNGNLLVNWNKSSDDPRVSALSSFWNLCLPKKLKRLIFQEYLKEGIEFGRYPWSRSLFSSRVYKKADLVHLQIVHDGTLDFDSIARILRDKPVVWTWHDPWVLTGHCIYPMECGRFQKGCGDCPDLARPFQIGKDLTVLNRSKKSQLIELAQTVHISTNWFRELILESSPIGPKIEVLPFGLSDEFFSTQKRKEAREYFGIHEEDFVIGIRSVKEPQKNFDLFKNALRNLKIERKVCVITLQELDQLVEFNTRFQIIQIPWTNNNEELIRFYDALDIFVMPSSYETFGFMGLEAMSRGVPVIGLAGTALDEICDLKKNGFRVENDPLKLAEILRIVSSDVDLTRMKSNLSREYVQTHFSLGNFLDKLVSMYRSTISKFEMK